MSFRESLLIMTSNVGSKQILQLAQARGDMGRYGEMWGDMGRHGETWGDMGRYGEMWGDMGRYGR